MNNIINYNSKYLTQCTKLILIKLSKQLKINIQSNLIKLKIINKINTRLLSLLTSNELKIIYKQLTINSYKSIKNKQILIKKLLYYINKYKKYNIVSIYLWNKSTNKLNNKSINKSTNKSINKSTNKSTNYSSFGITCEYILCKIYKLEYKIHSSIDKLYIKELNDSLLKFKSYFLKKYNMKCIKFTGNKDNSIDFICKNIKLNKTYTLSVKSNTNTNKLVCPQILGQCSYNTMIRYLKNNKNVNIKSKQSLKYYISKNLIYFFNLYFEYLFCCDYLLWIYKEKNNINYCIFSKLNLPMLQKKYFTLTTPYKMWKNCNTLKYKNIPLGIFYLHNSRNVIQFRFYFNNLQKIIPII